jgi:predicted PurR-regulated permease PerM
VRRKAIYLTLLLVLLLSFPLNAQSTKQAANVTLQEVINRFDQLDSKIAQLDDRIIQLEQKFDAKFSDVDKRLYEIEKTLAVYDERFKSIMSIFTIFGSVFGFVLLVALGIFGYYFNRLGQLVRQIVRIEERFVARKYKTEDELLSEEFIDKLKSILRPEIFEPAKVADESFEYQKKSKKDHTKAS